MSENEGDRRHPTKRFSDRVDAYVRFRPSYPLKVIETLGDAYGLNTSSVVADVGSGTGISAALFLDNGNHVFGIEPNPEMRRAAETQLRKYDAFSSIEGTAEATSLPDSSVDFVVAAQAFHWFDAEKARPEFARIVRPDGWAVLMWNSRRTDTSPFLRGYESLLQQYGTDYQDVRHTNVDPFALRAFFADGSFRLHVFENEQRLNFEGLKGRLLSSSYVPTRAHPDFQPMLSELRSIFDRHHNNGRVQIEYDTEVYVGRMSP